jgi:hypothetical protein
MTPPNRSPSAPPLRRLSGAAVPLNLRELARGLYAEPHPPFMIEKRVSSIELLEPGCSSRSKRVSNSPDIELLVRGHSLFPGAA